MIQLEGFCLTIAKMIERGVSAMHQTSLSISQTAFAKSISFATFYALTECLYILIQKSFCLMFVCWV